METSVTARWRAGREATAECLEEAHVQLLQDHVTWCVYAHSCIVVYRTRVGLSPIWPLHGATC